MAFNTGGSLLRPIEVVMTDGTRFNCTAMFAVIKQHGTGCTFQIQPIRIFRFIFGKTAVDGSSRRNNRHDR